MELTFRSWFLNVIIISIFTVYSFHKCLECKSVACSLTLYRTDLVGVRTKQKIPYGSSDSFCSTGSTNAAVFPLPVLAQPIQSRPERKHLYIAQLYRLKIALKISSGSFQTTPKKTLVIQCICSWKTHILKIFLLTL